MQNCLHEYWHIVGCPHLFCKLTNKHSFHGAAILETGCGGARTRCAHPTGARTKALVSSLVNRNYHVKHAKVAGTTVTTVLACLQSPASMHKSDLDCIWRRLADDEEFVPAFEMDAFDSDVMAESGD